MYPDNHSKNIPGFVDLPVTVKHLINPFFSLPFRNTIQCLCLIVTLLVCNTQASAEQFKVAFTGDQGIGEHAQDVLSLIAEEGTDLLLIQGDLGYKENSARIWDSQINETLGVDFPVLAVVGNHENFEWPLYQHFLQQRLDTNPELSCSGTTGVKARCSFANLDIVQVSPGIHEVEGVPATDGYAEFIRSAFNGQGDGGTGSSDARWRICTWHKNQQKLQTGTKGDSTGWDVYDACLDMGAMVAVAHEHAYSRSHLLSDFENQTIVHKGSDMTLQAGQSFVFVSGLGGREVRSQSRGGDWWASVYTATQNATHGALFCEFGAATAECYFKSVDGTIPDRFSLRLGDQSQEADSQATVDQSTAELQGSTDGFVFARTDKEDYRWIAPLGSTGVLGNSMIDRACAESLGGATVTGDWGDLDDLAPGHDAIASPCHSLPVADVFPPAPQSAPDTAVAATPFVFSRTDTDEYRWIEAVANGTVGSIWIDSECAELLGGPAVQGDWGDLMAVAPSFDAASNPCSGGSDLSASSTVSATAISAEGYVFSRTDTDELRWIDLDVTGDMGSIWIDAACAERLGGVTADGDWGDLMSLAPGFDTIAYPCF